MSDIEISKVVIKIGNKEAELTIDQARDLKDALIELLGERETKIITVPQPYPVYPNPYIYYRPYWTITYGDKTTCGDGTYGSGDTFGNTVTYSLNNYKGSF